MLLVKTLDSDYISKCYTNEASVVCPTDDLLTDENKFTEIILYSKLKIRLLRFWKLFKFLWEHSGGLCFSDRWFIFKENEFLLL